MWNGHQASGGYLNFIKFQAIVFVVGGGNYIEYQNLLDYAKVSKMYNSLELTVVKI